MTQGRDLQEPGPVLRPTEARQGAVLGHMRYVLAVSVALAVVAFAIIYFIYF